MRSTGWVACDYTDGDVLCNIRHGRIMSTYSSAQSQVKNGQYEGVRYVHTDGYLYVDAPEEAR